MGKQKSNIIKSDVARLIRKMFVTFLILCILSMDNITNKLPVTPSTNVSPYTIDTETISSTGILLRDSS